VRIVELVAAILFAVAGIRSVWSWVRRPIEGSDVVDHLLYALFVVGRSGLWFAIGGLFLIYASIPTRGRAAIDDFQAYRWYIVVPLALAGLQLLAGFALGRRSSDRA
jgi:hypothetical protein